MADDWDARLLAEVEHHLARGGYFGNAPSLVTATARPCGSDVLVDFDDGHGHQPRRRTFAFPRVPESGDGRETPESWAFILLVNLDEEREAAGMTPGESGEQHRGEHGCEV